MTALDAALALAQDFDVAVLVGQQLELDVARRVDAVFQINVGRTKAAPASCCACVRSAASSAGVVDDAHAASAAAGRSFQDHRIADAFGGFERFFGVFKNPSEPGRMGTPCSCMMARACSLIPMAR